MSFRLHPTRVCVFTLSDVKIKKKASFCNITRNPAAHSFVGKDFLTIICRYANLVNLNLHFFSTQHILRYAFRQGTPLPSPYLSLLVNRHISIFISLQLWAVKCLQASLFLFSPFPYSPHLSELSRFSSRAFVSCTKKVTWPLLSHVHERNTRKKKKQIIFINKQLSRVPVFI